jgi:hypothetical protein
VKVGDRVRIKGRDLEGRITELPKPIWPGGPLTGVHVVLDNPENILIHRGVMSFMESEIEVLG